MTDDTSLPKPEVSDLDLITRTRRQVDAEYLTYTQTGGYVDALRQAAQTMLEDKPPLHVGDIVRWKAHLKNKRWPAHNAPAIVMEVLKVPVFAEESVSDSPKFREPLDIVLGILHGDEEFRLYHFDSRRFERFPE